MKPTFKKHRQDMNGNRYVQFRSYEENLVKRIDRQRNMERTKVKETWGARGERIWTIGE